MATLVNQYMVFCLYKNMEINNLHEVINTYFFTLE